MKLKNLPTDIDEKITRDLNRRYTGKTVELYRRNLDVFAKYLLPQHINNATYKDITNFLDNLKNKGRSSQTRNQYYAALRYYFNTVQLKGFPFESYKIQRKYIGDSPISMTEAEVLKVIASAASFRDRMLLSVAYGSGLEVSEVMNLKPNDINFKTFVIKIRRRNITFNAVLSEKLSFDLQTFISEVKPKKYLFEGREKASQLSQRSVQRVFGEALRESGIIKSYSFKNLKYSFVNHLQSRGHSIISILKSVGNEHPSTALKYLQMNNGTEMVRVSPLDFIMENNSSSISTSKLQSKISELKNEDEKDYLLEAISCFDKGALRGGIILSWVAAMRNLQNKLLKHSLHSLNSAIQKHNKDGRNVRHIGDFAYILEGVQLKAACELDEIDKNEKTALENCLNLRNSCGHPSRYRPEEQKALAFLEDLLNIIFSK